MAVLSARGEEIESLSGAFPEVPIEAVLKEDLLRLGIAFSEDALRISSGFKPKSYFIFSFDRRPLAEMEQGENLRAPEEIALGGGPWDLARTVVSVRIDPASPHRVEIRDGKLALLAGGELLADVTLQDTPSYYGRRLESGKPLPEMAPTIEWGYLVYLTVYRKCQYFGFQEECRFCDINENVRQQRAAGRPVVTVKEVDEILEALEIIDAEDTERRTGAYTVTGGSITRHLRGRDEARFYGTYPRAINERFPGRWISKLVVQALALDALREFHDAGVQIYHPNYEVWDPRLFRRLCPGKERHVGRDEWIRRIDAATEVFEPFRIIPNFVAGIELARPWGFRSAEEALDSTEEGLEHFMSRGIVPRFTTWCPEPLSALGAQEPAPLAYHAGLLDRWVRTHRRHRLPAPPGYGPPGAGRAVFSVSAFMDALAPDLPMAEV